MDYARTGVPPAIVSPRVVPECRRCETFDGQRAHHQRPAKERRNDETLSGGSATDSVQKSHSRRQPLTQAQEVFFCEKTRPRYFTQEVLVECASESR